MPTGGYQSCGRPTGRRRWSGTCRACDATPARDVRHSEASTTTQAMCDTPISSAQGWERVDPFAHTALMQRPPGHTREMPAHVRCPHT
eukprot:3748706-Prymnesium_polylepis.1